MKRSLIAVAASLFCVLNTYAAPSPVSISATYVYDDGTLGSGAPSTSIDVLQSADCDGDVTSIDPEPFFDSTVRFTVRNDGGTTVRFRSYRFSARSLSGTVVRSGPIAFAGSNSIAAKSSADIFAIFLHASGGQKYFKSGVPIPANLGLTNFTFTVHGSAAGRPVSLRARLGAGLADYNRCGK